MTAVQLQLNLWQRLEQAQAQPEATDWRQLCLAFDEAIDLTPLELRLATAADAIEQMADLLLARATAGLRIGIGGQGMGQCWMRICLLN